MTSAIESPRRCFAESSPITQRTASMTFDLPHPLGPTIPERLLGKVTWVGSTKDLNPASLILVSRIHFYWKKVAGGAFFGLWQFDAGKKRGFCRLRFRVATPGRSVARRRRISTFDIGTSVPARRR